MGWELSASPADDDGFALSAQDAVENPSTRARAIRIRMTTSLLQIYLIERLRLNRPGGKGDVGSHALRDRRQQGSGQTVFKRGGDGGFCP
ncbi:MAG TPA: hypothetical protein DCG48_09805 [Rhodospirillaceae bacterium]|nr:hypothetical protein [Rhodospirillaceae bacterium]|tara:strand:+ start:1754 stop:2023 length:270 start_codon:yes stop_codon:yes gene_type:complete